MKVWKYGEMVSKIEGDLDLQDETFILPNELTGYFNEAIQEAEAEIHGTREDYFLTSTPVPLVTGLDTYSYPNDIYIRKIRGIVYANGTIIYPVKKIKSWHEFTQISMTQQFGLSDWYRHYERNSAPGQDAIVIFPVSRETAILPQANPTQPLSAFTPMLLWYLRTAQRIPLIGEFMAYFETYILPTAVNTGTNAITLTKTTYVTGDVIEFFPHAFPGGTAGLPSGLTASTLTQPVLYYVITTGTPGVIKVATSLANAVAGTAVTLTSTGSATGYFNIDFQMTTLIQQNLQVDIPEFATFVMQWVKCRCFEKEGDPRLQGATATLEQQRVQMVGTLAEMVVDLDTTIQGDFSHYQEMS